MARRPVDARCSFCGKSGAEVSRLVAGPGVFICDECVALCNQVVNEMTPSDPEMGPGANARATGRVVEKRATRRGWFRVFRSSPVSPPG